MCGGAGFRDDGWGKGLAAWTSRHSPDGTGLKLSQIPPGPAALPLLAAGLGGLGLMRLRRKAA